MVRKQQNLKKTGELQEGAHEQPCGKRLYGKFEQAQFPLELSEKLAKEAKSLKVSKSKLIVEAVAVYLEFKLLNPSIIPSGIAALIQNLIFKI